MKSTSTLASRAAAAPAPAQPGVRAVALAGLVALGVAMGVGRFAFTPLLPMMLHDGSVTLGEGGWLATLNYLGYFAGAAACLFIRPDPARMVRLGMVATVALTLGMAAPGGMAAWGLWRAAAGVASAMVMVYGSAWCMHRLAELGRASLGGVIFCGPGIGIVITGVSVFAMVSAGWRASWGWLAFGVLAVLLVSAVWHVFTPAPRTAHAAGPAAPAQAAPRLGRETWLLTFAYGLAGFGYIITATFLPVIARQAMPDSLWADLFWPIFGVGVTIGAFVASRVSTERDNRRLLVFTYVMQAIGVAIAVAWPTVAGFALSSMLAGLPFNALVSFAMREARRLWGAQAQRLMGLMTASYGLGQIVGPPLATALVARTGGFAASLGCAVAALLLGGAIFAWMSRQQRR